MLNILTKVSSLLSLLAPCLVWRPYIFCAWRYVFHFVTWSHKITPLKYHVHLWVRAHCIISSLLKSLVIIGILRKTASSKSWNLLISINWLDWITNKQEKNVTTSKMYIVRKNPWKLKRHFIVFSVAKLPSITLLLK